MHSVDCPTCFAAESQKSFCVEVPQRKPTCELVCVVHHCLWTLLVSALGTSFSLDQNVLLQWPADSWSTWTGWILSLPLYANGPGESFRCYLSWTFCVLHPSDLNHSWALQINEICPEILQSPHNWHKWDCPRRQLCWEIWGLVVAIERWLQKKLNCFSEGNLGNDFGAVIWSLKYASFFPYHETLFISSLSHDNCK